MGRGLPPEAGPGLDSQEEREEAEGRATVTVTTGTASHHLAFV